MSVQNYQFDMNGMSPEERERAAQAIVRMEDGAGRIWPRSSSQYATCSTRLSRRLSRRAASMDSVICRRATMRQATTSNRTLMQLPGLRRTVARFSGTSTTSWRRNCYTRTPTTTTRATSARTRPVSSTDEQTSGATGGDIE